jgi:parallel beta-helix repeat protein
MWVEEIYWPCFIDPKIGDYHKPLLPGTYNLIFRANGYEEEEHQVTVTSSGPTVLDVKMDRGGGNFAEQVTWANFYDPFNYPNSFSNNPTEAVSALGPPDNEFASLGVGGTIVLDMGEVGMIYNCFGDDFTIFEGDSSSDGYTVSVSDSWDGPWTVLGSGSGTTSFDLDDEDLYSARFIKIKDDGDGSATETNPGFDLDAIENLNPNEVFVDDDYDSSTPGWGYDHFDNLQDAIEVVAGLGELILYEGEYSAEDGIILDKPITIFGEGETKPVIEGSDIGNVITVLSDRVCLEYLIIKDSGEEGFDSGIELNSDFNVIKDCDIIENKNGIVIDSASKNNILYHNNFMDNDQNALDTGKMNQWDNGYPSGGNYWDDYTGSDSDLDGIGDSPHYIPGGSSEDRYPFMKPYGYPSNPPSRPTIDGSKEGKPGISYEYTFVSTDEDNDEIYYTIDWGDGTIENTSFLPSGAEVTKSHIWGQEDTYLIRAKAVDTYGDESDWGQIQINIPRSKNTYDSLFSSVIKSYPRLYLVLRLLLNFQF